MGNDHCYKDTFQQMTVNQVLSLLHKQSCEIHYLRKLISLKSKESEPRGLNISFGSDIWVMLLILLYLEYALCAFSIRWLHRTLGELTVDLSSLRHSCSTLCIFIVLWDLVPSLFAVELMMSLRLFEKVDVRFVGHFGRRARKSDNSIFCSNSRASQAD